MQVVLNRIIREFTLVLRRSHRGSHKTRKIEISTNEIKCFLCLHHIQQYNAVQHMQIKDILPLNLILIVRPLF